MFDDLLGIPYVDRGRDPLRGLDCYGLVLEVGRRLGIQYPDVWYGDDHAAAVESHRGDFVRVDTPEIGDLVLMTGLWNGPTHVGIVVAPDAMMETTRYGVRRCKIRSASRRIVGFYRWGKTVGGGDRRGPLITQAKDPATLGTLAIGLGLSALGAVIQLILAPTIPKPRDTEEAGGGNPFDLGALSNRLGVGGAQPVLYGRRRVGGQIISAFQKTGANDTTDLYMLLMVSRGPIQSIGGLTSDVDGLVGSSIPDAIEIDGNPASAYDATVSIRLGDTDQDPIEGFREQVTATPYAQTLYLAQPFGHAPVEAAEILEAVLSFPAGLYDISPGGNVAPRDVQFAMRYRVVGTTAWTTSTFTVLRGRRGPFTYTHRVSGLPRERYEVEIERMTRAWPETETDKESRSDLVEIHEITDDALNYPGKALIGIRIASTDQVGSSIPTITATCEGRKVWVWNGSSFGTEPVFTRNPAWCVLDMITDPIYGMARGGHLSVDNCDLVAFESWADLCDEMVDDGRGGTTERARLDHYATDVRSGWDEMHAIAASHWARLSVIGRQITPVPETTALAVYAFGAGNSSDWQVAYIGRTGRPNSIQVQYANEEQLYEADTATRLDEAAVFTSGQPEVVESLQAVGVVRPAQAYRLAQYRLNYATQVRRRFTWVSGPESVHIVPGDIVYGVVQALEGGISGRVVSATSTTVVIDRALVAPTGSVQIIVRHADDTLEERFLAPGTYAKGASIPIDGGGSWTTTPVAGSPYGAGIVGSYRHQIRVVSVETTPGLTRRFAGDEYVGAIYDDDPGVVETGTPDYPSPRGVPGVPQVSATAVHGGIRVEWTPAAGWDRAEIWTRLADEEWVSHGVHTGTVAEIRGAWVGDIARVSVTPVAPGGLRRRPDMGAQVVVAPGSRSAPPPVLTSVVAEAVDGVLTVRVDADGGGDVAGVELRHGPTFGGSVLITARAGLGGWSGPAPFLGLQTVWAVAVTVDGVRSDPVGTTVTVTVPGSTYTQDSTSSEAGTWGGTVSGTEVDTDAIILSSGQTTGTYVAGGVEATGSVRGHVTATAGLRATEPLWEDLAAYTWIDIGSDVIEDLVLTGMEVEHVHGQLRISDLSEATWDGLMGDVIRWDGLPIDVPAALTPTVEDNHTGSYRVHVPWTSTTGGTAARVTLRRPSLRYVPELSELTITHYDETA